MIFHKRIQTSFSYNLHTFVKFDLFWEIEQIEIYNEQNKKEKILNFEEPKRILFSIIKNNDLYDLLSRDLKKSNNFNYILLKLYFELFKFLTSFFPVFHKTFKANIC